MTASSPVLNRQETSPHNRKHQVSVIHRPPRILRNQAAPVIFLLHGMADSHASWLPILPALDSCDVWLFDLPWSGVAGSDWAAQHTSSDWWQNARDLCPVHPDLCIGHSFGAAVLLDWAAGETTPRPLCDLLLVSPLFLSGDQLPDWGAIDHFARTVPDQLAAALRDRMSKERHMPAHILDAMARGLSERILPGGIIELFSLLLRLARAQIENLKGTVTILRGEDDIPFVAAGAMTLAARTQANEYLLENCGHIPMVRHADAFASILAGLKPMAPFGENSLLEQTS